MTSLFTGRNIAVHYNHSAELLAVREIDPTTGEPGPHLAVTDRIILRNAFFPVVKINGNKFNLATLAYRNKPVRLKELL